MFHKHLEINHQPQTLENNMSKEFKIGDLVYCPMSGTNIFKVKSNEFGKNLHEYSIMVSTTGFTVHGKSVYSNFLQDIFHATPENHELLEKLYGIEFEKPPVKPTSKEIVKAYLDRGDKGVCCWASDYEETPTADDGWVYISECTEGEYPFITPDGEACIFVTPFNHTTFQPITELPE